MGYKIKQDKNKYPRELPRSFEEIKMKRQILIAILHNKEYSKLSDEEISLWINVPMSCVTTERKKMKEVNHD